MPDWKNLRRKRFIDPEVQGPLITRVVLYWVVFVVGTGALLLWGRILGGPPRPLYAHLYEMRLYYGPFLVAALLLLPLIVIDIIRFSHRFAGPLYRLRRSLRDLAWGEEHVEPIEFRSNDLWQGLADEFNGVLFRMRLYADAAEAKGLAQDEEEDQEADDFAYQR